VGFLITGFIVGVECLSGKIACIPCTDGGSESWEKAVTEMIEGSYGEIRHIVSDRDVAVTSKKFRRGIWDNYGIRWTYLRSRSKAFRAERQIRNLKERLSTAMRANPGEDDWTRFLPAIIKDYNSQKIPGTDIRRNSVNKNNYMSLLEDLYQSKDPDLLFNVSSASNFSADMKRELFRFAVGEAVLLRKSADYTSQKSIFDKASVRGNFGPKPYTIRAASLKANGTLFYTPVYSLRGLRGWFYDSELIPATFFRDASSAADEGNHGT
jgi:hypothetical protein